MHHHHEFAQVTLLFRCEGDDSSDRSGTKIDTLFPFNEPPETHKRLHIPTHTRISTNMCVSVNKHTVLFNMHRLVPVSLSLRSWLDFRHLLPRRYLFSAAFLPLTQPFFLPLLSLD